MTHPPYAKTRPVWAFHIACTLITIALAIFIGVKSLGPAGHTQTIPHMDKLLHFGAYFVLTVFASFSLPPAMLRYWAVTVIILCIAYGGILEGFQYAMMAGRTASLLDGLANSLGVICGIGFALWSYKAGFLHRNDTDSRRRRT